MSRWHPAVRPVFILALVWAGMAGCSRQVQVPRSTGPASSSPLPFNRVLDGDGVSPTEAFVSEWLPSGSEISVRLRSPLSSATSRAGDSFEAVLDSPAVIAGKTVIPLGAAVIGTVLDARASSGEDFGYLRLTVASVLVNQKSVVVHASSIFAKGRLLEKKTDAASNSPQAGGRDAAPRNLAGYESASGLAMPHDVRFSTGHRLTFRLIQPLHL